MPMILGGWENVHNVPLICYVFVLLRSLFFFFFYVEGCVVTMCGRGGEREGEGEEGGEYVGGDWMMCM